MVIVLDSNVLVYAVGAEHPLREPCRRIVAAIRDGVVKATATVGVIDEFVHIHARRRDRATAVRHAEDYLVLLSPLLVVEEEDVRPALRLFERLDDLDASDAMLAALTVRTGAEALISADQAFASVPKLRHVSPGSSSLDELIRSS